MVDRATRLVSRAAGAGAQVICLPEHWLPGRKPNLGVSLLNLQRVAKEYSVHIIPGAEFFEERGTVTVTSVVMGPDGEVGRQSKTHLFGREKERATPGDSYSVSVCSGAKIGIAICHDLVYPEVARILALKGAEVIFAPARISRWGMEPWHLYLKARALENRIPIVSPNVVDLPRFSGGSRIVGLVASADGIVYTKVLASAGVGEKVLLADLDLKGIEKHRLQRLAARRPETYSELLRLRIGYGS